MNETIFISVPVDDFVNILQKRITSSIKDIFDAQADEERFLTIGETCKLLAISKPTLHRWTKNGTLTSHRIGTAKRYKRSEVMEAARTARNFRRH